MRLVVEALVSIRAFFEMGGPVLFAILVVAALMWALILERLWYLLRVFPAQARSVLPEWESEGRAGEPDGITRQERKWRVVNLRRALLSRVGQGARRNLKLIEALMQVLPLLGLLGTVWGMVLVFDIMTVFGTGNARLMASGVSRATIPTMSGLVAALSALYVVFWLRQRAAGEMHRLEGMLKMDFEAPATEAGNPT